MRCLQAPKKNIGQFFFLRKLWGEIQRVEGRGMGKLVLFICGLMLGAEHLGR
jgi:hypothetical protein